MNQFWGVLGDFLDIHAALRGGHHADFLRRAVDDHAKVVFFFDVRAFFNQQAAHFLSRRPRLMGDQLHAENLLGVLFDLVHRLGDFHTAAFATTACMDLCFDHPHRTAQCLRRFNRVFNRKRRYGARYGYAVFF